MISIWEKNLWFLQQNVSIVEHKDAVVQNSQFCFGKRQFYVIILPNLKLYDIFAQFSRKSLRKICDFSAQSCNYAEFYDIKSTFYNKKYIFKVTISQNLWFFCTNLQLCWILWHKVNILQQKVNLKSHNFTKFVIFMENLLLSYQKSCNLKKVSYDKTLK